jgi:hypothetical protein
MTGSDDSHPADLLIRELIARPRSATEKDVRLIADRVADAPFSMEIQEIPPRERERTYQGITLGKYADSLTRHLFRRIYEEQWATGTTADAYVRSLHRAVCEPSARIALYQRWGSRDTVAFIVPTRDVLKPRQIGAKAEPNLLVVYEANRGILISGYQFSSMATIRIPGDAIWLR